MNDSERAYIDQLIERSSLGQPGAQRARNRVPSEFVTAVVDRSIKIQVLRVFRDRAVHMSHGDNRTNTQSIQGKDVNAMADVQVTCITKADPKSRHESITHVGGGSWKWPVAEVIRSIENGSNTFYTRVDGVRAEIKVVHGPTGKYLRTHRDGRPTDNLLELPQCR